MRLLSAIDEARYSFEELRERVGGDRPPGTRTLRRYLAILADAGFPWYFDRASGTYRFPEGYGLHRPDLSDSALVGLMALRRMAASLGPAFASGVDELTRRIGDVPDRGTPMVVRVADVALDPERHASFETLQRAQRERRRVAFHYVDKTGRESLRRVDLYGFVVSSGRIYAIGHDHGRNAMRTFALDAIDRVQILPNVFPKPTNFDLDRYAAQSISGLMSSETPVEVTVRFSPLVARAARAARVVRDRRILERDDGSVEIVYAVADPLELVRWTLGWGDEAEIVAPEDVRARAGEVARRIAARYAATPAAPK